MIDSNQDPFEEMAAAWEAPVVARSDIAKFTGGMLRPKTMANLDCQGVGPSGRFRMGGKVGYTKTGLVEWLRSRADGQLGNASRN